MESGKGMKHVIHVLLILGTIMSCSAPERIPEPGNLAKIDQELLEGKILFNNYCGTCHPKGLAGLGPAIINKPLPKFLMHFQVRHGLGVMPAFDDEILEDKEVKQITSYIVYLRKKT